jgi:hypothetical protein
MQSKATTIKQYIDEVPDDRKKAFEELRNVIKMNLPKGFQEAMSYGMPGFVVPHSKYPAGYHCDPKQPLPFISLASQKNFIAIYHMGIYADPKLQQWFTEAHAKTSAKKLDMGKSCLRYKNPEDIPLKLIGELSSKLTPDDWINLYEEAFKKSRKK